MDCYEKPFLSLEDESDLWADNGHWKPRPDRCIFFHLCYSTSIGKPENGPHSRILTHRTQAPIDWPIGSAHKSRMHCIHKHMYMFVCLMCVCRSVNEVVSDGTTPMLRWERDFSAIVCCKVFHRQFSIFFICLSATQESHSRSIAGGTRASVYIRISCKYLLLR